MQQGLTSRLSKLLLISVFLIAGGTLNAAESDALDSDEPARYLGELKALYLTSDERKALLTHSNSLLKTYGLRAEYQVGQAKPADLHYQLSVGSPGELRIREERRDASGNIAVRNRGFSVFGMDPFIQYQCPPQGLVCTFGSPTGGDPWLTILRDPQGAEELAKALSFLFRNLQKG
ncbi:hypothetical protein [Stutzerimonas zhaodongensis]|uniref:hypothetical protein n=1 Tax=Stutzerimonas zhaodongensis TaxID=1176257 RepID=UPI001ABEE9E6|nr:hypothetical protein [Stutzerimonas zhaodongensis]MCQ4315498.1 hypothetical protein [Stutzerimonas zhaodongensis]